MLLLSADSLDIPHMVLYFIQLLQNSNLTIITIGSIASGDFQTTSHLETRLSNITCQGNEERLMQCNVDYISQQEGRFCQKAGVICQGQTNQQFNVILWLMIFLSFLDTIEFADCTNGDIRLLGSSSSNEGTIEMCVNHAWGTICDDNWDARDGNVACAQLGFQPFGKL